MFDLDFKIKDLISYEEVNDTNILKSLQFGETDTITDLIVIGSGCSADEAVERLDKALQNSTLAEIINDIVYCLIGKQKINEDTPTMDKKDYESLTDVFEIMYQQLKIVDGLSLSDFMNMSVRYLYRYADGVQKSYILKKNEELQSQYSNVAMLMSALGGKLKECPQLDETGKIKKMSLQERIIALKKQRDMEVR